MTGAKYLPLSQPHHPRSAKPNNHSSSFGIGFHTAYQLLCAGAKVYISARNALKAEAAIQEIQLANPAISADKLLPVVADLGDLRAVKDSAQKLLRTERRLDLLVNNAALWVTDV